MEKEVTSPAVKKGVRPSLLCAVVWVLFLILFMSASIALLHVQFQTIADLESSLQDKRQEVDRLSRDCATDGVSQKRSRLFRALDTLLSSDSHYHHIWEDIKRKRNLATDAGPQIQTEEHLLEQKCKGDVKICLQGATGERGIKGDTGNTGLAGLVGPAGPKGPKGLSGNLGQKGQQGVRGPKGEKGERGFMGVPGSAGVDGIHGSNGDNGPKGTEGALGEKGEIGGRGLSGLSPQKGNSGPKGDIGEIGSEGLTGSEGEAGIKGLKGTAAVYTGQKCGCARQSFQTSIGKDVMLYCPYDTTNHGTGPTVTWYKDNTKGCPVNGTKADRLYFPSLSPTEVGEYQCQVSYGPQENYVFNISLQTTDPNYQTPDCNFDNTICKWQSEGNPIVLGNITNAPSETIPLNDHTSGNGKYAILDPSGGLNSTSLFISPRVDLQGPHCVSLWYQLRKDSANTPSLSFGTLDCHGNYIPVVTENTVTSGWKQIQYTVNPGQEGLQLAWEQDVGPFRPGSTLTVAYDDVKVSAGACKPIATVSPTNTQVTQTLLPDGSHLLSCSSSGTPAPDYQWFLSSRCDKPLPGGKNGNLTVPNEYANAGIYTCVAQNTAGSDAAATSFTYPKIFTENFESANSLGSIWSNVNGSGIYNWIRLNGPTPSSDTGPLSDHTYGSSSAHYVYLEASNVGQGGKTILQSPAITGNVSVCLTYWHHMYGINIERLQVTTVDCKNQTQVLETISGNQGNQWNKSCVYIPPSEHEYRIRLEGTRGSSYHGDIALDDINIQLPAGVCCGKNSAIVHKSCNFEVPPYECDWIQDKLDNFDWLLSQGTTLSSGTGPDNDHTYGNRTGHYIYIEASDPRVQNDIARWNSVYLDGGQPYCLNFWYSMYGTRMGTLEVITKSKATGSDTPLLILSGNKGNQWLNERLEIPPQQGQFQIVFQGKVGSGFDSDIALDDISIDSGNC